MDGEVDEHPEAAFNLVVATSFKWRKVRNFDGGGAGVKST
jgi:hypothetical protein